MSHVLAVFGSSSRASALLATTDGTDITPAKPVDSPFGYLDLGLKRDEFGAILPLLRNLHNSHEQTLANVQSVFVCCTGAGSDRNKYDLGQIVRDTLHGLMPDTNWQEKPLKVEDNAAAVMKAGQICHGASTGDGLTIISGRGSFVQFRHKDRVDRQGGYGSPCPGDPGSSFDQGRQILLWLHTLLDDLVAHAADSETPPLPISAVQAFLEKAVRVLTSPLGDDTGRAGAVEQVDSTALAHLRRLRNELRYSPTYMNGPLGTLRLRLADLSKWACSLACGTAMKQTTEPILEIRRRSARDLVNQVAAVLRRNSAYLQRTLSADTLPVYLFGESFRCRTFSKCVRDGVAGLMAENNICARIDTVNLDPAFGCLALACEQAVPGQTHHLQNIRQSSMVSGGVLPQFQVDPAFQCGNPTAEC